MNVLRLLGVKDGGFALVLGSEIVGLSAPWIHTDYGENDAKTETAARSVYLRGGGMFTVRDEPETTASILNAMGEEREPLRVAVANVAEIVREGAAVAEQLEREKDRP